MADYLYRIHPAIGIARVGNSEEYYIGPETAAGLPLPTADDLPINPAARGGLPINPATNKTITSKDLRDGNGGFKRQAARFRIFQYPDQNLGTYPTGQGTEILIGSTVNGKTVKDIIWTVHLANKKANTYVLVEGPAPGRARRVRERPTAAAQKFVRGERQSERPRAHHQADDRRRAAGDFRDQYRQRQVRPGDDGVDLSDRDRDRATRQLSEILPRRQFPQSLLPGGPDRHAG